MTTDTGDGWNVTRLQKLLGLVLLGVLCAGVAGVLVNTVAFMGSEDQWTVATVMGAILGAIGGFLVAVGTVATGVYLGMRAATET